MSILEHCVKRAISGELIPIICTSVSPSDNQIEDLAKNLNIDFFRGNELNKINRWFECFNKFGLDYAHLLDVDDPYFNPIEITKSLIQLKNLKNNAILSSKLSMNGFASVGVSVTRECLEKLSIYLKKINVKQIDFIPWESLFSQINLDNWQYLSDTIYVKELKEVRLTIDYDDDHKMLTEIAKVFNYDSSREEIEKWLFSNPDVIKLNIHLNRIFHENQKNQESQIKSRYL